MNFIHINNYVFSVGISLKYQAYKCNHTKERYQGTKANVTLAKNSNIKI